MFSSKRKCFRPPKGFHPAFRRSRSLGNIINCFNSEKVLFLPVCLTKLLANLVAIVQASIPESYGVENLSRELSPHNIVNITTWYAGFIILSCLLMGKKFRNNLRADFLERLQGTLFMMSLLTNSLLCPSVWAASNGSLDRNLDVDTHRSSLVSVDIVTSE